MMARKKKDERTNRHFGHIFQRKGRPGYYVRFQIDGKRRTMYAGPTEDDAEKKAAALLLARDRYKAGLIEPEPERPAPIKFEKYAERHLKHLEREHRDSTYRDEKNRINNFIVPAFKGKLVNEITPRHVKDFLADRMDAGNSKATRNRFRNVLSVLFGQAIQDGYREENPVKGVSRLREDEHAVPALSHEEQEALIQACPRKIRDFAMIALDTGLRRGEILRLEWRDVDLAERMVTVRHSKSGKSRVVHLTARLVTRLQELKDKRIVPLDGPDRVLAALAASWSGPTAKLFKRAAAAIGQPQLRPHDMRHLFAVNLVRAGVPLTDVAKLLGHSPSSIAVTMRYAKHAPEDFAARARDILEASRQASPMKAIAAS
jgi:integrase